MKKRCCMYLTAVMTKVVQSRPRKKRKTTTLERLSKIRSRRPGNDINFFQLAECVEFLTDMLFLPLKWQDADTARLLQIQVRVIPRTYFLTLYQLTHCKPRSSNIHTFKREREREGRRKRNKNEKEKEKLNLEKKKLPLPSH